MRSRAQLRAIVPVWAKTIEVTSEGESLLITGWGRSSDYAIDVREIESGQVSRIDIRQHFRRYAVTQLKGKKESDAGVYQFADADSDDKLTVFCGEFGPICGELLSIKPEANLTFTLTVAQSMQNLRREQKRFAAAVRLLQQVNRNAKADCAVMREAIRGIRTDEGVFSMETYLDKLEARLAQSSPEAKTAAILPLAHLTLCELLNEYPPKLVPLDGEVVELACTEDHGIRSALYDPLRRDYKAQREIGTCLNCNLHFPVFKHGTRACSNTCRTALRNLKYWNANRITINAERREKHKGRQ
jgi:hypothetical protein